MPTSLSSSSTSLLCNSLFFLSFSKTHLTPSQLSQKNKPTFVPLVASISNNNDSISISPDVLQVVCPSLAFANTMFFNAAYNVQVIVDENEHEEKLVGRFRREVMRAGIIQECKRRKYFENKQEEKKRRTRDAAKRNRKRRPWKPMPDNKQEANAALNKKDDEEDNWELPEGNLPN